MRIPPVDFPSDVLDPIRPVSNGLFLRYPTAYLSDICCDFLPLLTELF